MNSMDYRDQIQEILLGRSIVEAAKEGLALWVEGFQAVQEAYRSALRGFEEEEDKLAKRLAEAVDRQCASLLFFAGVQGLQMNLTHFQCPMTPNCTWPQVDGEDFLRLGLAEEMPGYAEAEREIDSLTEALKERSPVEAVKEYRTVLETAGMRLAHYWGYLLGNDILPLCTPGYRPDAALDVRYRHMLETHFGRAS